MTEFHLIPEPLTPSDRAPDPVRVPPGVGQLRAEAGAPLRIDRYNSDALEERTLLEAIQIGQRPFLVVISPEGSPIRVNGQPAPRVALVGEKDLLQVPGVEYALHVTLYHQPHLGLPPAEAVGKECPVCRDRITADDTVYACACGAVVHCDGEEKPAEERRECLKLSTDCPVCSTPVVLTQGYSYVPEL